MHKHNKSKMYIHLTAKCGGGHGGEWGSYTGNNKKKNKTELHTKKEMEEGKRM